MTKILAVICITGLLLLSLDQKTSASEITLSTWKAQGFTKWRIEFPIAPGSGASELYYPQNGTYLTARYESPHARNTYFSAEGGYQGNISAQKGSDSDWNYTQGKQLWYYGDFQTTGSSTYLNLNWHKPTSSDTEIFYGYSYRNNSFRMTDGLYTIYNYQPVSTQLPNLHSTYDISYQGPHIGAAATHSISPAVSAVGSVLYSPLAAVRGTGWWNLRDLDFVHTGPGQIVDANLGLRYAVPQASGAITVGYRFQWLDLINGWENTSSNITWKKATTIQQGLYINGEFRF